MVFFFLSGRGRRWGYRFSGFEIEDEEVDDDKDWVGSSGGDSGCNVVDEEVESSVSEVLPEEGECALIRSAAADRCRVRMECVI